jgi:UDP-sulfoquinovose synthase
MRVLILGIDGYIGWPLALHLDSRGHDVLGMDNHSRDHRVYNEGSSSLTSIDHRKKFPTSRITLGVDYTALTNLVRSFQPEAIIHLAEQPSAAYSMKSVRHATETQQQNVIGTLHLLWAMKESCPSAHLIKLGTMGEYGTPNCDIPEGRIPEVHSAIVGSDKAWHEGDTDCPYANLLFPRSAGSFYHLSKVHDTHNIEFACRNWGLHSTDIMQGVVFGLNETKNDNELTRFDYDECFGTVINRFCVQAIIGHSLTVYGKGEQTRGFLPLKDSIQCLTIALNNPPSEGEYRTFNQFENLYTVNQLAKMVQQSARDLGLERSSYLDIDHIPNPRLEAESHYYNPVHHKLFELGYTPTQDIQTQITNLIRRILPFRDRVIKEVIMPKVNWRR